MSLSFPPRQLYYNGKAQPATSGKSFQTINPATATPLADIQIASNADVDAAITAADHAFPSWAQTPLIARARILHKAAALLRERNDEIARIETLDSGKAFTETSTVDVTTGADVLEYYANFIGGGGLNGETTQLREDAWVYTKKAPLGVCAGIGAWNYPIQIALWKSAACLAAGNTMVYKPSEYTPLHGQTLAEIYTEAGLPDGVFNVINGAGDVGAYLTGHPLIAKVSFTGQVATGMKVAGAASGSMKYVTMELGGKSPLIICPDAELESAVNGAMMANFYSTGQVCTNGTRVFVPRTMKAAFEKSLLEKIQYVRAGPLFDEQTNFGPLSSKAHYDKVVEYIRHGIESDRATLLCGGVEKPSLPKDLQAGFWVQPTVFTDCNDSMRIVKEEIFGPVMSILYYDTVEEAVQRANTTELGLAAGVFTKDLNQAHRVIDQLQAGITWVNTWGESPAEMAVGGWKKSGLGVENGRRGIEAWLQNKSTLVDMSGAVVSVFAKL
ncbi:Aldehyde dehydrogenase, N-terminal [Penicillium expansum]|uniref:aldehyde dehydrogenase (NAD(+)) n=1 Tax=Penicillium expansum TaxID=27334 RepID=A0A0A2LA08_PENEN|nr:Aldehyde dehydrogenase, N-terminal [Penicillium expansum]KAJ5506232.1 Aldehyde dehydrogenase N-terminal [Penicillium expansum]KGO43700.1 Aldehyde dehydrogenase, N-terminal [Penicillium expansum]KGO52726.1 Aldehyde dehydrogenase, N-terminal [Penicillium expansum]KGO73455.1 Aldehyde dehydrogenase, N-terminal [Penicillium expansum]